jgi:hypothetical protein
MVFNDRYGRGGVYPLPNYKVRALCPLEILWILEYFKTEIIVRKFL